jgi:hypothetical protein
VETRNASLGHARLGHALPLPHADYTVRYTDLLTDATTTAAAATSTTSTAI